MSIMNARTSLFFYFVMLIVNLVSRKIFIDSLGDTLTGLTTTMQFTVGLLNMADIGIVTAISCALFTPIYSDDRNEIRRIISLFSYLFKIVGAFIVVIGGVMMFLLPRFVESEVDAVAVYVSFLTFLFTTSLSYFVNYKQQLLLASQRTYVVTSIQNSVMVIKILVQIWVVKFVVADVYYWWLFVEAFFAVIYSVLIEWKVRRDYEWLKPSFVEGWRIRGDYKELFSNLKQIISHKFANVVLTQTDSIVIAYTISLVSVTYYYNYTMIISKLLTFVSSLVSGSWASVGNLISEGKTEKVRRVFYQYNSIVMLIGGVLCVCVYLLADPFIVAWIGEEYVLERKVFIFMIISLYVAVVRIPLTVFLNGYSLYQDTWSAWLEAGLNLVISVVGSFYFGLIGVVVGTAVSTFIVTFCWKPYFLYKNGFNNSVREYYIEQLKFIAPVLLFLVLGVFYAESYILERCKTMLDFVIYAFVLFVGVSVVYSAILFALSSNFRSIVIILFNRSLRKR